MTTHRSTDPRPDDAAPDSTGPNDDTGLNDSSRLNDSTARRVDALFSESTAGEVAHRRRRGRARKAVVAGVVVTSLVAGAVWANLASGDAVGNYRTATVGAQDVSQQLVGVATIEPVTQAAVAFPVAGTVAGVDVAVGDTVSVGQQLATLDTESLIQDLNEKNATLAQAELNLSKALAGETVSAQSGSGGSGGSATSMGTSLTTSSVGTVILAATVAAQDDSTSAGTTGTRSPELVAARQAVVDAQAAVDDALVASQAAMAAATSTCSSIGTTDGTTSTTTPVGDDVQACVTALTAVQDAQTDVATAQAALAAASTTLDDLLASTDSAASAGSTAGSGGATGGSTGGTAAGSAPSAGSAAGAGTNGASTTDTVSSEDLIAAQKAVDAAELEVAVAQQAIAQATIVSPIAGTVVSVGLEVGEAAESGSSTQSIVVQGTEGYEVVTTVAVDRITDVRIGQSATVIPDGGSEALDGTVVAISGTPDAESTTTSYRVTIGLSDPAVELGNGSTGTVTITTDGATSALAVPTSAVSTDGDRATVTVLDGASTEEVAVTVGAVGEEWTQIVDGVSDGQTVVLADLDADLPSSATSTSSSGSTGTTGSGSGGFTGGPPSGMGGMGGPPN